MVNVQTGTVCGDRYSPGVLCRDAFGMGDAPSPWCPITDDMTYWERRELLGDDSYGYEDGMRSSPTDFYYDDPRDNKEWCERDGADAA